VGSDTDLRVLVYLGFGIGKHWDACNRTKVAVVVSDTPDQFVLSLDSPLIGTVKNDRTIMFWNFFSLTKERQTELPTFDDGRIRIEVQGTQAGVANIWDKEVLIYVGSLMQDKINRGEPVDRRFMFTANDFFRVIGIHPGGTAYQRIEESLKRLQGTQITTNIETGGEGEDAAFSWVSDYKIQYRRGKDGQKVMKAISLELCDWLYRAVLKDQRMLTHPPAYFKLSPIERRLYEIARSGPQGGFRMNIEKLRRRVGSESDLKVFKQRLIAISKRKVPLPEYGLAVVNPRLARSLDARQPPPTGRTPLKSWMVFFYRTDKLANIPPAASTPLIDDLPDGDEL
jgi:plasmid replication initiation protein